MTISRRLFSFALLVNACIRTDAVFAANEVIWNYSGIVRNYYNVNTSAIAATVPPEFAATGVVPGAPTNGFMRLNLNAPDSEASTSRLQATGAIVSAEMQVGLLSMQYRPGINIFVIDTIEAFRGQPRKRGLLADWSTSANQGIDIYFGGLELFDADEVIFPNDAMPAVPPLLSELDPFDPTGPSFGTRILFAAGVPSGLWLVYSELTSLSAVPEPSTLVLALVMSAANLSKRRRK